MDATATFIHERIKIERDYHEKLSRLRGPVAAPVSLEAPVSSETHSLLATALRESVLDPLRGAIFDGRASMKDFFSKVIRDEKAAEQSLSKLVVAAKKKANAYEVEAKAGSPRVSEAADAYKTACDALDAAASIHDENLAAWLNAAREMEVERVATVKRLTLLFGKLTVGTTLREAAARRSIVAKAEMIEPEKSVEAVVAPKSERVKCNVS